MKTFTIILGILFAVGGVLGGLYVGGWLMFIGGIVQIIEGVKADPVSSMDIALGIGRLFIASTVGVFITLLGVGIGNVIIQKA